MRDTVESLVGAIYEGRYEVHRVLSLGGTGTLFEATQLAVARLVAIRIVNPDKVADPEEIEAFRQQARHLAALHHANVVGLIDFGVDSEQRLYLVREWLDGERLYHLLKREAPLAPERILHIVAQILDALAEAHKLGIVHRDLNPRNIFLTRLGATGDFVKLMSFRVGNSPMWAQEDLPHYRSPEQLQGLAVGPASDIYSLGVIMYEMMTGRVPFPATDAADIVQAHVTQEPPAVRVGGVPMAGALVDLTMRCLSKVAADRPQTAAEALGALTDTDDPLLMPAARGSGGTLRGVAPLKKSAPQKALKRQAPAPAPPPPVPQAASPEREVRRPSDQAPSAVPDVPLRRPPDQTGTGPMLHHPADVHIRHSTQEPLRLAADCDLNAGEDLTEWRPRRSPWPVVLAALFLIGVVTGGVLLVMGDDLFGDRPAAESGQAEAPSEGQKDDQPAGRAEAPPEATAEVDGTTEAAADAGELTEEVAAAAAGDAAGEVQAQADGGAAVAEPDTGPSAPEVTGNVRVESIPAGATIKRKSDGQELGQTPKLVEWDGAEPLDVVIEAEGYESTELTLEPGASETQMRVELRETKAARKKAERKKKRKKRRKKRRRSRKKVDSVKDLL